MSKFIINIEDVSPGEENTLGEDVNRGDVLYMEDDGNWYKATAADERKSKAALWVADEAGQAGEIIRLVDRGYFNFNDNVSLEPGQPYYLSMTPGKITTIATNKKGEYLKYVGTAISKHRILLDPSSTYIEGDGTHINGIKIDADKHYIHDQTVESAIWECQHNLNKRPSVSIVNSDDSIIIGDINYDDENRVTIRFTTALRGKAYFN